MAEHAHSSPALSPATGLAEQDQPSSQAPQSAQSGISFPESISVVLVAERAGSALTLAMSFALQQPDLRELIVIDKDNTPSIRSHLLAWARSDPRIKLLRADKSQTYAYAVNLGVRRAGGDYAAVISSETLLPPGALHEAVSLLHADNNLWMVGAKPQIPGHAEPIENSRLFSPWHLVTDVNMRLRRLLRRTPAVETKTEDSQNEQETAHATPTSLLTPEFWLIRRDRFLQLGGWDEEFHTEAGLADFCLRLRQEKGGIAYHPKLRSLALHALPDQLTGLTWAQLRDFLRYYRKHFQHRMRPGFVRLINGITMAGWALRRLTTALLLPLRPLMGHKNPDPTRMLLALERYSADYPAPSFNQNSANLNGPLMVTGAETAVGLCLLHRLATAEKDVTAVTGKAPFPFPKGRIEWIETDLSRHYPDLRESGLRTLIHTAPMALLPRHLEMLAQNGLRQVIVIVSPQDEDFNFPALESAIREKCRLFNIQYTILRAPIAYGLHQEGLIALCARQIHRLGISLPPASLQRQPLRPVHADDIARAALSVIGRTPAFNKSYVLMGKESLSLPDIARQIFALYRWKPVVLRLPWTPRSWRAASPSPTPLQSPPAEKDFQFNPRPFLSGGGLDIL